MAHVKNRAEIFGDVSEQLHCFPKIMVSCVVHLTGLSLKFCLKGSFELSQRSFEKRFLP